jgi:hypothetical protein
MLESFVMSLALTSLASAIGPEGSDSSPATWRWHVSRILDAQRAGSEVGALDARSFDQRYQRYSALGLPEPALRPNAK